MDVPFPVSGLLPLILQRRSSTVPKNLVPVGQLHSQSQYDLALGVHPTRLAFLNPVYRQWGHPRLSSQFGFAEHLRFSMVPEHIPLRVFHCLSALSLGVFSFCWSFLFFG
jgi:hypothetical protein